MTKEPIEKVFHSKDLNIAYAKGKEEEKERILEIIDNWIDKQNGNRYMAKYFNEKDIIELKSKIEGKSK